MVLCKENWDHCVEESGVIGNSEVNWTSGFMYINKRDVDPKTLRTFKIKKISNVQNVANAQIHGHFL